MHEEETNLHTSFHSIAHHQTEGCSSERMDCSAELRIGNVSTSQCSFLFDYQISKICMRKKTNLQTSFHSIAHHQTEGCSSSKNGFCLSRVQDWKRIYHIAHHQTEGCSSGRMDFSAERRIGNVSTSPCSFLFDYQISKICMRKKQIFTRPFTALLIIKQKVVLPEEWTAQPSAGLETYLPVRALSSLTIKFPKYA
ncbi:hypothetical protein HNY73_017610 [Argiope bruennichi]|uniref:Uncharacterized protein n=1 Tax=Argiope bruennichi TaxID=94029 RepID=A0A8T0EAK0_ARGBR|nr:hypothetical protein HNY73_017610 [Argiope bruennichi]